MSCTVVKLSQPLDLSSREVFEVEAGCTLQSLLDDCGEGHWSAFINGELLDRDAADRRVREGEFVGLVNMPQGPLLAALPYLLIAFVSGYIAYRLIDRDIPDVRGDEGSPTYAFGGIGNNRTEGLPIPVVYGKHRTGGTIISEFGGLSGTQNMTISQLIVVSEGPIYGFGQNSGDLLTDTTSSGPVQGQDIPIGFRIEEAEAQNLVESSIQTRLGQNVQSAMGGFNVISNETPYGIRLNSQETTSQTNNVLLFNDGDWETDYSTVDSAFDQYATTFRLDDQDYDSFTTRVEFPQGLARVDTQGNYSSSNFQLAVRYRKLDASGLPVLTGGPGNDGWLYEPFPGSVQASTRQRILREFSFPLRDPSTYDNGGGINVGKIFDPGSTATDGELESVFTAGHSWRNFWTDVTSAQLNAWLAEQPSSNHVRFMLSAPANAMNAFVLGGVYKVDMSRLVDDQYPRVAVLAEFGSAGSQTGVAILAATQPGSSDLELRLSLRFGSTTVETAYTIPNYDESWMRVEYRQTWTNTNGGPPPNWNGGNTWQYQPMGLRHSLWVNGVEVDHRQYNSNPVEFAATYGFTPVIRYPNTLDGIYCKTLDSVYIDEVYYGETGRNYSRKSVAYGAILTGVTSAFQPAVDSPLTTSIIDRVPDVAQCATYLFDVNTGTGPTSFASASTYGDYAGDLQLKQGNGTIGVTDGIVLSSGSSAVATPGRYECQALRVNVDSSHDRTFDDSVLDAVIGIRNKTLTYPTCALVGQKVRATDQINNQKPRMTTVVWGRLVPTLYGAAPAYAYSSNPAWVAADLLLNKRIGLGNRYSVDNIDLESIREWAKYCDEGVYDGGRQFTTNNAGLATSTDWDDILFDNSTAASGGIARGSLTLYLKQTSSVDSAPYLEGQLVRLHGFPDPANFPLGVATDINNGAKGSNVAGGYYVKSVEEDPLNAERWKITLWWDRLDVDDDPWTSGTLLSTAVTADGGDQNDITGATVEGGEPRHQFNGVFDKEYNVWDALLAVCQAGRAKPVMTGNTVRFSVDRPRSPIGMIGMGAIKKDSFEVDYAGPKSRANSYEVVLFPESNDWERATEIVNDPDLNDPTQFDQFRRESIQTQGITSRGQARREGIFRIKSNKLRLRSGKMTLGPEALSFEPGDVIYLSHDVMCRGVSGRVLTTIAASSAAQQFEIDRDITIESGKTYLVYARDHESDEVASASIATINGSPIAAGDYAAGSTVRFASALPFLAVPGKTTWSLVVSGEELQVEITGITMKENLEHEVEWLEYNADVYEDAITEPLPEQQFLDGSGSGTGNAIGGAVLAAHSVTVIETNARAAGDTYEPGFEISWRYNRAHSRYIKGFRVLQKSNPAVPAGGMIGGGALDDYRVVAEGQGLSTQATVRAQNCTRGSDVEFRVYLYGGFPSTPPDFCDGARVVYRGAGPTPAAPTSASMRFNEERAVYYARQSDNQFREQIEWRRGSWILGDRVGRITPGDAALGPTDNWAGAVTGDTNLYAATVTPLGQYSVPLLSQQAPAPILDEIAFDATWQSQAWESYVDGWKTDSLPPAYDPQLSNLQRASGGYLEFTGTSLTGTYTTANELIPAPREQQIIRPVRVFLQPYWEASQVHPADWGWAPDLKWRDNVVNQWTWEGPLSDGLYTADNCTVECQARFSEDGVSWGDWLPLTPGMYAITAVQFRLVVTRSNPSFNVQINKFHTKISQKFRTITDRDRMTAFIEREII